MCRGPRGPPRKTGGGRSERYDERREARAVTREYAPGWSDAASRALSAALADSADRQGKSLGRHLAWVLSSRERSETLARRAGAAVGIHDRQNLMDVLLWRHTRYAEHMDRKEPRKAAKLVKSTKEALRVREAQLWRRHGRHV